MLIITFQHIEPPAPFKGGSDFFISSNQLIMIQDFKKKGELIMDL